MTSAHPHEAWCPSCRVTHPPGTRVCIHCGGRVLAARPGTGAPPPLASTDPFEAAEPDADERPADARAASRALRPMRLGLAVLWIVIAVVGAIARACAEHR